MPSQLLLLVNLMIIMLHTLQRARSSFGLSPAPLFVLLAFCRDVRVCYSKLLSPRLFFLKKELRNLGTKISMLKVGYLADVNSLLRR